MQQIQQYMFLESFDEPETEEERRERERAERGLDEKPAEEAKDHKEKEAAEPEEEDGETEIPPPPTFSEEDLEQARKMGVAAGREEGLKEARKEAEQQIAQALDKIAKQMASVQKAYGEAGDAAERAGLEVARAVTGTLAPELARRGAIDEVEAMVRDCLPFVLTENRLVLRVAEDLRPPVKERIDEVIERMGFPGELVVLGDGELLPGDARMEWESGGVERNIGRLRREVDAILDRHLTAAGHELDGNADEAAPSETPDEGGNNG